MRLSDFYHNQVGGGSTNMNTHYEKRAGLVPYLRRPADYRHGITAQIEVEFL